MPSDTFKKLYNHYSFLDINCSIAHNQLWTASSHACDPLTVPQFLLLIFHYLQHIIGMLQQGLNSNYGLEGFVVVDENGL
jgi:hypothetical protein